MNASFPSCNIPPVFVVGCYRSGTSLMRLMLSAHPKIHISAETNYIDRIGTGLHRYGDLRHPQNLQKLHEDILTYLRGERWASLPDLESLMQWSGSCGTSYASIVTFYGTWDARRAGKNDLRWWGDNTPRYVHCIPYLSGLFPNAKYLFMIRDPRDVVASARSLPLGGKTEMGIAYDWERALTSGLLAERSLGNTAVKTVRYEELVSEPETILREVCGFLDVPFDEAMLGFHLGKWARELSTLPHHARVTLPVSADSVGRYRRELGRKTLQDIEGYLCTAMRELGYLTQEAYAGALRARLAQKPRHYGLLILEAVKQLDRAARDRAVRFLRRWTR